MKKIALLLLTTINLMAAQKTFTVDLAWDPVPDTNVFGYVVYSSTNMIDYQLACQDLAFTAVATTTSHTNTSRIVGIQHGEYRVFWVTAHDMFGVESLPSNAVDWTAPNRPLPPTITLSIQKTTNVLGEWSEFYRAVLYITNNPAR